MAPRATQEPTEPISEHYPLEDKSDRKRHIYWTRVIFYALLHILALYGLLFVSWRCSWYTLLFGKFPIVFFKSDSLVPSPGERADHSETKYSLYLISLECMISYYSKRFCFLPKRWLHDSSIQVTYIAVLQVMLPRLVGCRLWYSGT